MPASTSTWLQGCHGAPWAGHGFREARAELLAYRDISSIELVEPHAGTGLDVIEMVDSNVLQVMLTVSRGGEQQVSFCRCFVARAHNKLTCLSANYLVHASPARVGTGSRRCGAAAPGGPPASRHQ
eukprot:363097-Chlamydomonas_euryale.AAC.7